MGMELNPLHGSWQGQMIYVIDDDIDVRRSLHFLLSTIGFTSWPFACAFDFLENLPSLQPAPIILDVRMPEIDGFDLLTEIANRTIKWPVIVVTGHADIQLAVKAIKGGAIDVLEKPLDVELLEISLKNAMDQLFNLKIALELESSSRYLFDLLSPREREVLMLLAQGHPNKVIAHRLSLSVRTVEMHRANALHKLKVKSIAEVAHLARNGGISLAETILGNGSG